MNVGVAGLTMSILFQGGLPKACFGLGAIALACKACLQPVKLGLAGFQQASQSL